MNNGKITIEEIANLMYPNSENPDVSFLEVKYYIEQYYKEQNRLFPKMTNVSRLVRLLRRGKSEDEIRKDAKESNVIILERDMEEALKILGNEKETESEKRVLNSQDIKMFLNEIEECISKAQLSETDLKTAIFKIAEKYGYSISIDVVSEALNERTKPKIQDIKAKKIIKRKESKII